jgi:hypothetical protein
MNASIISAVSALLGAAIGGFASFFASWMTQRIQVRAQWLTQETALYLCLYNACPVQGGASKTWALSGAWLGQQY